METYKEFLERINSFEKEELKLGDGNFHVNTGLLKKVDKDNKFTKFFGDTVVFDLDDRSKSKVASIIDQLYQHFPECFCERLKESTLHMTLHDLNNSPDLNEVAQNIFNTEIELSQKLKKSPLKKETIKMKTNVVFNMVNTSMVLGLYPANESEYIKLMKLYEFVDETQNLPYPLTPHITLAYYDRKGFNNNSARNLENLVTSLNKINFEIELSTDKLMYQKFTDMNNYINIFSFT